LVMHLYPLDNRTSIVAARAQPDHRSLFATRFVTPSFYHLRRKRKLDERRPREAPAM
jgi:hypothetical protein